MSSPSSHYVQSPPSLRQRDNQTHTDEARLSHPLDEACLPDPLDEACLSRPSLASRCAVVRPVDGGHSAASCRSSWPSMTIQTSKMISNSQTETPSLTPLLGILSVVNDHLTFKAKVKDLTPRSRPRTRT